MEENIKSHNINWYKNTYNALINKAILSSTNNDDIYKEKHHIIPKCMGGTDDQSNIVLLDARSHVIAHMLLSCIYPENYLLNQAVIAMLMVSKFTEGREESVRISTRLFAKFREENSRLQKGKVFSKEHKEKISKAKLGKKRKKFTQETCNKISIGKSGKKYGTKVLDENSGIIYSTIQQCSQVYKVSASTIKYWITNIPEKGLKLYVGNDHNIEFHRSVRVIGPDGTIYKSITDCGIKTKHDRHTIARWIKENPEKGFKYE